jgi:2-dehydro-3-deoxygluconokinase
MELLSTATFDLVTLSSMGVRITPVNHQPVATSQLFEMQSTSAETNVLNVSASLGLRTKVLTKFVKDSPISSFLQGQLRQRRIEFEGLEVPQGGPWGFRHQFNVADTGYGVRGPRVYNDRAGEVGRSMVATDFDLQRIFVQEGCRILHISGLIAAMSKETAATCLAATRLAKKNGSLVSFDLNYRASFWEGRSEELFPVFAEIASMADILIGNEEDFQLALKIQGPKAGGKDISSTIQDFQKMISNVNTGFPNAKVCATTLREVIDANTHNWGALLLAQGQWFVEEPRTIPIYDRIGGGDAFVGGLLYGILRHWQPEAWLQFGWATGALATTLSNDYVTPTDESQVWDIYRGNARVKR